ncbi:MAG TPA: hypothetical protein VF733_00520 [Candidatus Saccharimonadales bacterium]
MAAELPPGPPREYCTDCPTPIFLSSGREPGRAPDCKGPVFIVEDASKVTELHHLRQYANPDSKHRVGEVYCGRKYRPAELPEKKTPDQPRGGNNVSPGISGEIWVNLEAMARDEGESTIGGLLVNAGELVVGTHSKIKEIYESSNNSSARTLIDHLRESTVYISSASDRNAVFINQLNDYLVANPFTNPSGLEPLTFNEFTQTVNASHRFGAIHATMGTVNEHLQQEVDRVESALGLLTSAQGWAELRHSLFIDLVGAPPSNDNLQNAGAAALACAANISLCLRHLNISQETMTRVRL